MNGFFTTGEIASRLNQPIWLVRRIVDSLAIELPRVGLYRLVPESAVQDIAAEIERRSQAESTSGTSEVSLPL